MTQQLQRAIEAVSKLAPEAQDAIAAVILDEMDDENLWQQSFLRSGEKLAQLANKARAAIAAGHVVNQGFDGLSGR